MADFTGNVYSNVLGMNTAVRIITSKRSLSGGLSASWPERQQHGLGAEHPLLSVGSGL